MLPSEGFLERFAPLQRVPLCPELTAHQAGDVFALWRAWERESGREQGVPFWALVWPGAAVLARLILDGRLNVAGRRVLDMGCGGAIAAIAAARAGAAAVIANDIDPAALSVATANARANGMAVALSSNDLTAGPAVVGADLVFLADLFYERAVAERTLAWLDSAWRPDLVVVVADGGRPFAPRERMEVLHETDVPVNADLEGVAVRHVTVGRLVRA